MVNYGWTTLNDTSDFDGDNWPKLCEHIGMGCIFMSALNKISKHTCSFH